MLPAFTRMVTTSEAPNVMPETVFVPETVTVPSLAMLPAESKPPCEMVAKLPATDHAGAAGWLVPSLKTAVAEYWAVPFLTA